LPILCLVLFQKYDPFARKELQKATCIDNEQSLIVQPPWDTKPHGLFATRSPHRPNPIGYSVVELVERRGNILRVRGLDAIEGTPVLDIKPFIKKRDCKPHAVSGWIEHTGLDGD